MRENNQTNSNRGGARKGAGRKAGSATKKTRAIADKAAASGITPLEVMLMAMEALVGHYRRPAPAGLTPTEEADHAARQVRYLVEAADVAKDAAPYMHPRLAAVTHTGEDGGPINHSLTIEFVKPKP